MIRHQEHSNAFAYLSEYGQSDCGVSIRRCPNIYMDVAMWEHTFEMFLGMAKFTTLSIIITNFV
jgi:hypothetical protein